MIVLYFATSVHVLAHVSTALLFAQLSSWVVHRIVVGGRLCLISCALMQMWSQLREMQETMVPLQAKNDALQKQLEKVTSVSCPL